MSLTLGSKDYLELGNWNAICDVCGFKYKASELQKRWDGVMVCPADFEQRHPQDLIRLRPEKQAPPWSRPDSEPQYITPAPVDPDRKSVV